MNSKEKRALDRIFRALTHPEDAQLARKEMLIGLCEITESMCGEFEYIGVVNSNDHRPLTYGFESTMPQMIRDMAYYLPRSPLPAYLLRAPKKLSLSEDVDPNWYKLEFYNEFFRKWSMEEQGCLLLRNQQGVPAWMMGGSQPKRGRWTKRRLFWINWLAPHLERGLQNLELWHSRGKMTDLLAETFNEPICALRPRSRDVVWASSAAEKILGLENSGQRKNLELAELFEVLATAENYSAGVVSWTDPTKKSHRLWTRRSSDPDILFVRFIAENAEPPPIDDAARARGLSEREIEVFKHLSQGLGDREIARNLGISSATVRTHLRRIYTKLNVTNRVEAINVIAAEKHH